MKLLAVQESVVSKKNHLWYIHEETIGVSLFDDQVPNTDKKLRVY